MSEGRTIKPNAPADFTPQLGDYKTLQPFRYWCQKVLPLVYDDSLSYYELLCKVVDYMNKTMEDVETLHGDVTNLHAAYDELQSYVNDYFNSLDVQEEINNKLDDMASSGELYEIIMKYTDGYVTPEMYGAVGDGITDDTSAINEAIQTQKIVLFSSKTYVLKDILVENKTSTLIGNSTILKFANGVNNKKWFSFVNCRDITITGFTFNGNRENQTIVTTGEGKDRTENCPIILFDCVENGYVYNCYFNDCQGDGVQVDKLYYSQEATNSNYSKNIHIYENKFEKNGRNGISICHCDGCTIENNIFVNMQKYSTTISCGIDIEPNPDYKFIARNITIANNIFEHCLFSLNLSLGVGYISENIKAHNNTIISTNSDVYGIYITSKNTSSNIEVSNNNIYGTVFGIYSTGCNNVIFADNKITVVTKDNETSGGGIGVYFTKTSKCKLIGNTIVSTGIFSIYISTITDTIITKNLLNGNNAGGYSMLFDNVSNLSITYNEFNENKYPINSRSKTTSCTIVNNFFGENKEINIENPSNIVIYNNYTKRNISTIQHTSTTFGYEYTGLSITIPAYSEYNLNASVEWNESEPKGIVFSKSSENMDNLVSVEGKYNTFYSGYTITSFTLYLWVKYTNEGATNPCVLLSSITG